MPRARLPRSQICQYRIEVLESAVVRSHSRFGSGEQPLDVGALADVCLFYQKTSLVFGRGTLRQLLVAYGAESVVQFTRDRYVRPFFLPQNVRVLSHDVGAVTERRLLD